MKIQPSPNKPHGALLTPVMAELHTRFGDSEVTANPLQRWREADVLQRESTVYLVSQGTHSFVFVSSPRLHSGKPLLGQIYSKFLFDPYRRPYRFSGKPSAVAQAWEGRCIERSINAFDEALAPLFALAYGAATQSEREEYVQTIEDYRGRLDERRHGLLSRFGARQWRQGFKAPRNLADVRQ